jgi:hypothetical protein
LQTPAPRSLALAPGANSNESLLPTIGDTICMRDVRTDQPLRLTVFADSTGDGERRNFKFGKPKMPKYQIQQGEVPAPESGMLSTRVGGQSRGLFPHPDCRLHGTVRLGSVRTALLQGDVLVGTDHTLPTPVSDHLAGNYGCIVHLDVTLEPSPDCHRAVVLLVASAGFLAATLYGHDVALHAYDALVLFNEPLTAPTPLRWDYTLPANSFGPARLLFVPLRQ